VHTLDLFTRRITSYPDLKQSPTARSQHASSVLPGTTSVLVVGGYGGHGKYFNDFHILHPSRDQPWWTVPTVVGEPPPALAGCTLTATASGLLLLFGGHNKTEFFNQVHVITHIPAPGRGGGGNRGG